MAGVRAECDMQCVGNGVKTEGDFGACHTPPVSHALKTPAVFWAWQTPGVLRAIGPGTVGTPSNAPHVTRPYYALEF